MEALPLISSASTAEGISHRPQIAPCSRAVPRRSRRGPRTGTQVQGVTVHRHGSLPGRPWHLALRLRVVNDPTEKGSLCPRDTHMTSGRLLFLGPHICLSVCGMYCELVLLCWDCKHSFSCPNFVNQSFNS